MENIDEIQDRLDAMMSKAKAHRDFTKKCRTFLEDGTVQDLLKRVGIQASLTPKGLFDVNGVESDSPMYLSMAINQAVRTGSDNEEGMRTLMIIDETYKELQKL